ncbi:alkaline phosphatase family protein [Flavobacterium caeni]|uniref:Sulfatase n=1 Tax=Flavobacterium caeni TaxID=490189 RepID=A0A1G5B0M9_9FLAO|nr:hypothetical protein [Flavobacterium caeni]SCX83620.1 hypothetical protein SAMN02927903_00211 [Flavobacterium caeni]
MAFDPAKKLRTFVSNDKPYPLISGFVIGFYMLAFYYSKNLELGSSWESLAVFAAYFVLLPMLGIALVYRLVLRTRWRPFAAHWVFVSTLAFLGYFLLEHFSIPYSKRIVLGVSVLLALVSVKFRNHKIVVLLVAFMTAFPLMQTAKKIVHNFSNPAHWNKLPDAIEQCRFTKTPNVYFLQMDGYADALALQSKLYRYDNLAFDAWLRSRGFTLYDGFRSNYNSTLKSNSSMLSMKHHYSLENVGFKNARDYVMGDNPVLRVFKNNGYQTHFISERPYFLISRPVVAFDHANFATSEVPYLKDGWSAFKDITQTVKSAVSAKGKKFVFIQKFNPGHIAVYQAQSQGVEGERKLYIEKLEQANAWLRDIIPFIEKHDPSAMIIIGADHGGFVGMQSTKEAFAKINDPDLLRSIFGAKLAIKWNGERHAEFDLGLRTSVNLFRTVFAFLGDSPSYLQHLEPDVSYNNYDFQNHEKIYPAIKP